MSAGARVTPRYRARKAWQRPPQTENDHGPRVYVFSEPQWCEDCNSEIEGLDRCWVARVNDRRVFWHLLCRSESA